MPQSQECITTCWRCRHECQKILFNHCIVKGGEHSAPEHVKLLMDCIQMCQTAADTLARKSPMYSAICEATAEICEATAASCEALNDDKMQICAELCLECAACCRDVSRAAQTPLAGIMASHESMVHQ